ncbi:MAG: hypothetical protein NTV86_17990 [Planctomycetota bacterium]|nr:hypothetical protein [Planctomycetota bacterium]
MAAKVMVLEAERLPLLLPGFGTWLGKGHVSGGAKIDPLTVQWKTGQPTAGRIVADAGGLDFEGVLAGQRRSKRRDVPATVDLYVRGDVGGGGWTVRFANGTMQLGATRIALEEAQAAGRVAGKAKGAVNLTIEPALTDLLPEALEWIDRYGLAGQAEVKGQVEVQPDRVGFVVQVDAGHLAIGRVDLGAKGWFLTKPGDMEAVGELEGQASRDGLSAALERGSVSVADAKGTFTGTVKLVRRNGQWEGAPAGEAIEQVSLVVERAESLLKVCPALGVYEPAGTVRVEASGLSLCPRRAGQAKIECRGLRGQVGGKAVRLEGALKGTQIELPAGGTMALGSVKTDSLEFALGKNHGYVVAEVSDIPSAAAGTVQLVADSLDDKDIKDWINPPPPAAPEARPLTPGEIETLRARAVRMIDRQIRPYAQKAKLKVQASIDDYRTWDNDVSVYYQVRSVDLRLEVAEGRVTGGYTTGLNGGVLTARCKVNLLEPEAKIRIDKSVRDVMAKENVQPQLARYFPGNTVEGLFNQTAELDVPLRDYVANAIEPRYPVYPVGKSRTHTVRGVTRGRAAPESVTKIFPGLNLAEYHYRTMTSFSDHLADGSTNSDMVFDGKNYDLYIIGKTDADHIGVYEMGLILNVPVQSAEFNHRTQLGRLPILKIKARIEGGQLHDEEVSYPGPKDSIGIVYNPIDQAWIRNHKATPEKAPLSPGVEEEKK